MIGRIKKLIESLDIKDIDLESDFIELPLRHHRYELKRTTPFEWELITNDTNDTLTVRIIVDKQALGEDKDIEELVLSELKNNQAFKDFVDDIRSFEPHNKRVINLYKLSTWKEKDSSNLKTYTKVIRFGA